MTFGLVQLGANRAGGWRSLTSGFIVFSFLALAGLLAVSGHSMHQFLAVVYLLVAAFVMTHVVPKASGRENDPYADADFELDGNLDEESSSCDCSGKNTPGDRDSR